MSVTPVSARYLERMITRKYLIPTYNGWLPCNQSGLRTSALTTTLINLQQKIVECTKDDAKYVRILSIDFSEAFDRVQHSILIDKLIEIQQPINPYVMNCYREFLSQRKIFTATGLEASIH